MTDMQGGCKMSKMSKLGGVFLVMVVVLTPVMPRATSADQGSPIPTPTTTVDWGDFPGWANAQGAEGHPDPEAAEDFRQALLDLRDILEELYPYAQHYAQVSGQEPPPLPGRQLIQALTPEELNMVREAFGDDYEFFEQNIKTAKSMVLASGKEPGEGQSQPSLSSFTTIPTPTPVTTPPPGITHQDHDQINEAAGDLAEPGYPTSVGCPKWRYPHGAMLGLFILKVAGDLAGTIADTVGCEGTLVTVPLFPLGCVGSSAPGCLVWAIVKGIALATNAIFEGFSFCNGGVDGAELGAAFENIQIIHADLHDHDRGLTTRANTTDKFLFNFRNLNLRQRIEDNLGSPEDSPIALFTLPRKVCMSTELETLQATDPYAPEVIAGCGLLELVQDIVRSAIDMHFAAGQDVHNAEAEFAAAMVHYNNDEWKLAFTRLRNAYRDAVRP
jgi:hypothetical protein